MSERLTISMKDRIQKRVTDALFKERDAAVVAEEHLLADRVYLFFVGERLMKKLEDFPPGWIHLGDYMYVILASGERDFLHFDGDRCVPDDFEKALGASSHWRLPADQSLHDEVADFFRRREALKVERLTSYDRVRALLAPIGTTTALRREWPEGEEYYADVVGRPANPVAVSKVGFTTLNAELGLTGR